MADGIRLNKYLSEAGVCSRRAADTHIENGKVTINGETAVMGQKVMPIMVGFIFVVQIKLEPTTKAAINTHTIKRFTI